MEFTLRWLRGWYMVVINRFPGYSIIWSFNHFRKMDLVPPTPDQHCYGLNKISGWEWANKKILTLKEERPKTLGTKWTRNGKIWPNIIKAPAFTHFATSSDSIFIRGTALRFHPSPFSPHEVRPCILSTCLCNSRLCRPATCISKYIPSAAACVSINGCSHNTCTNPEYWRRCFLQFSEIVCLGQLILVRPSGNRRLPVIISFYTLMNDRVTF